MSHFYVYVMQFPIDCQAAPENLPRERGVNYGKNIGAFRCRSDIGAKSGSNRGHRHRKYIRNYPLDATFRPNIAIGGPD